MSYHLIAAQIDIKFDKKANHTTTATFINNKLVTYLIAIIYNLPLLFFNFSSIFKYLFYVNIFIIILSYILENKNYYVKKKLLVFFLISWFIINSIYIFNHIFI
jgi:4-hydroxybenzoate polyprenyltransferase